MVRNIAVFALAFVVMAVSAQDFSFKQWKDIESRYIIDGNVNRFSFDFLETLFREQSGNFAVSPVNLWILYTMRYFGAQNLEPNKYWKHTDLEKTGLRTLIDTYYGYKQFEMNFANKIFYQNTYTVNPTYKDLLSVIYHSTPQAIDFKNREETVRKINEWVKTETNSRIMEFSDKYDENTRMVFLSAAYLRGEWEIPFDVTKTVPKPFHYQDGTIREVPMMVANGFFGAGYLFEDRSARIIDIRYKARNLREAVHMYIIVPEVNYDLAHVERKIKTLNYQSLKPLETIAMNFWVPKVRLESTLDLEASFTKFGLGEMFMDGADFSQMTHTPIKVNKFWQKAVLDIDEYSTEHTLTPTSEMRWADCGMRKQRMFNEIPTFGNDFYVDRPYLVVIGSEEVLLWAGRVVEPKYTLKNW